MQDENLPKPPKTHCENRCWGAQSRTANNLAVYSLKDKEDLAYPYLSKRVIHYTYSVLASSVISRYQVNGLEAAKFHNKEYIFGDTVTSGSFLELYCSTLGNYQPAYLNYMEEYQL